MALSKQQKLDMLHKVELRLAKEELAEQYIQDIAALENSKHPMTTLKNMMQNNPAPAITVLEQTPATGQALLNHQRDHWHDLNEHHSNQLAALTSHDDITALKAQQKDELDHLLACQQRDRETVEKSDAPLEQEQAILHSYENAITPEILARMKQEKDHQNIEEPALNHADFVDSYNKQARPELVPDYWVEASDFEINLKEQYANAVSLEQGDDFELEH